MQINFSNKLIVSPGLNQLATKILSKVLVTRFISSITDSK